MGRKSDDLAGAFCCGPCHRKVDGVDRASESFAEIRLAHAEAVIETNVILKREGKA
jgi:hypothetical protein